jgi:hypothetical protein
LGHECVAFLIQRKPDDSRGRFNTFRSSKSDKKTLAEQIAARDQIDNGLHTNKTTAFLFVFIRVHSWP